VGGIGVEDTPFPLTDTDRRVLSQTDRQFRLHDWEELRGIIGEDTSHCLSYFMPPRTLSVARVLQFGSNMVHVA
jgi:hypothetical protein